MFCISRVLEYKVFQKYLYSDVPCAMLRVLRKRLFLKAYKLSIIQGVKRWMGCTPVSVNVFVNTRLTITFRIPLYVSFETPCNAS
jgi:hypothetical protein